MRYGKSEQRCAWLFLAHAPALAWVCSAVGDPSSCEVRMIAAAQPDLLFRIHTVDWIVDVQISQPRRELTHRAGPLASRH